MAPAVFPDLLCFTLLASSHTLGWSHTDVSLVSQDTFLALFGQVSFVSLSGRLHEHHPNSKTPEIGAPSWRTYPPEGPTAEVGARERDHPFKF